ncbi:hypothetical protein GCM10011316_29190 [Roseibium aquae]|uniref:Uncharacterized protein n=1 Tax=Roseibium aquae TaxID=1323746 RepID=A0A916TNZ3_9HYPH|nr:hypothetical protein [Roseibium aquae]GGB55287.1 hypothetical protein GCM10011316_29190 [Roseibium aquae]
MISTGHWTRRELAMLVGLDRMGDSIEDIALVLERTELDVRTGLETAKAMLPLPGDLPRIRKRRRMCVLRNRNPVPARPCPGRTTPEATAALMGDPAPGRSALDQIQAAKGD